jgi:hypothetical protein
MADPGARRGLEALAKRLYAEERGRLLRIARRNTDRPEEAEEPDSSQNHRRPGGSLGDHPDPADDASDRPEAVGDAAVALLGEEAADPDEIPRGPLAVPEETEPSAMTT